MRVFFGIILGIIITVGAAYFHDSDIPAAAAAPQPADPAAPTPPADLTHRRIVNWDVLEAIAGEGTAYAEEQWNKIVH